MGAKGGGVATESIAVPGGRMKNSGLDGWLNSAISFVLLF